MLYKVIESMKNNRGGLVLFNNFLMMDDDSEVSFAFASSCQSSRNLIGIFF